MIPQVVQPTQYPSQRFGSSGYAAPPSLPFESFSHRPGSGHPTPLPYRNSRDQTPSTDPSQRQRSSALENRERQSLRYGNHALGGSGLRSRYNDPSEHMLRRKTPNGTLAAGYNGEGRAALKHVVLPLSGPSSTPNEASLAQIPDSYRTRQIPLDPGWNHLSSSQYSHSNPPELNRPSNHQDVTLWTCLPSLGSDTHAFLNHLPVNQASNYLSYDGTQIPTVLQPIWQPSLGPTASNDGGLYGPYWPDGRYVPYRPAAFREYGQVYPNHDAGLNDPRQNQIRTSIESAMHYRPAPYDDDHHMLGPSSFSHPVDANSSTLEPGLHLPNQTLQPNSNIYPSDLSGSRIPITISASRANHTHFKERTLSWAHSIYVDLLAYLHETKTDNRNSKLLGAKNFPKHSIYPKPPRQSHLYADVKVYGISGHSSGSRHHMSGSDPILSFGENDAGARVETYQSSSNNDYREWSGRREAVETNHNRTNNQELPHYIPPFQTGHQAAITPLAKAKDALEMLTTLCEQSAWRWIDGMLLGGCLAYGLEDYHRALEWYTKIIAIDSKHVEAISNLAATLLCLNRREEAEQYWLQSVKLRPSYFEAVEHLIGLLCGDHRGIEAVGIIEFVERSLRLEGRHEDLNHHGRSSSNTFHKPSGLLGATERAEPLDYDQGFTFSLPIDRNPEVNPLQPGFGSSGFSIAGSENGRILALVHAKGNMLYALGHVERAAKAFEAAVLISAGVKLRGITDLIQKIVQVLSLDGHIPLRTEFSPSVAMTNATPLLLPPDKALRTAELVFTKHGELPGLRHVPEGLARRAAVSTTSNSLLSLAKIFQDAMSNNSSSQKISTMPSGVGDILALYYLSLSLQPSPSTANNVGILLASVQQPAALRVIPHRDDYSSPTIPGVTPGSGVALALAYYNYGLHLDAKHAHLYTNLGSLLKDIGQLTAAIKMYEQAVACDSSFDIALANLANAVKDQGRTSDAIGYYRRAVASSPDFAEAVCGLANALNSVCDWAGRGGVLLDGGQRDRWHVDDAGMILEARSNRNGSGWMKRVVDIVDKQLKDGAHWGQGSLHDQLQSQMLQQLEAADSGGRWSSEKRVNMHATLNAWSGKQWEGARITRLVERAIKRATHRWYQDRYIRNTPLPASSYPRPRFPSTLSIPSAPTVLPFHTFTCPLSAKDIRMISQRNALRISCSTLRAPWMQGSVFEPPPPPNPHLNVGYVSSDFNNHPLAHLMQSVFGLHDPDRVKAFCYALTPSDHSIHRQQIEREAPVFRDVNDWPTDRLVQQIVQDDIHILVNLNGYTRGARNEIFAARAAPIQMSFMGFAGTLGAEWCDYILADETAIPPETLRPWRRNLDLEDQVLVEQSSEDNNWVYSENIIFCQDTFFCCDHAQSEPRENRMSWEDEQFRRWQMRKELFPSLSDDAIILGNFNQLYKIDPTTFRTWLRILDKVPKAILWLLRFPDLGESNLKRTAQDWAGESVASRIWFTDVAPKHQHISRARVCDLFLDTPECNAHTTAADILWSSTPLLTLPRYKYKMCSRMAASILKGALPRGEEGRRAASELIAADEEQYEDFAIRLASGFSYVRHPSGRVEGIGRLGQLRKLLYDSRWTCALFDTKRWVSDLERAYEEAWRRWVANEGGDIYL
ncbi:tetratricopeptide [Phlyctema vagabunda]|uniref:protein O-GlcNAc transferase n=1 Tax=Phlyctema vagabunda TaxID=108571 RepID=A0ABR4PN61_9HELO